MNVYVSHVDHKIHPFCLASMRQYIDVVDKLEKLGKRRLSLNWLMEFLKMVG